MSKNYKVNKLFGQLYTITYDNKNKNKKLELEANVDITGGSLKDRKLCFCRLPPLDWHVLEHEVHVLFAETRFEDCLRKVHHAHRICRRSPLVQEGQRALKTRNKIILKTLNQFPQDAVFVSEPSIEAEVSSAEILAVRNVVDKVCPEDL